MRCHCWPQPDSILKGTSARRQVGQPHLKMSAQLAHLGAWSISAAKRDDGRKRICRASVAQVVATSSVRTKMGRPEKASAIPRRWVLRCVPWSNSHSIPFASSREPHIAYPPANVSPFPDAIVNPDGVNRRQVAKDPDSDACRFQVFSASTKQRWCIPNGNGANARGVRTRSGER